MRKASEKTSVLYRLTGMFGIPGHVYATVAYHVTWYIKRLRCISTP